MKVHSPGHSSADSIASSMSSSKTVVLSAFAFVISMPHISVSFPVCSGLSIIVRCALEGRCRSVSTSI